MIGLVTSNFPPLRMGNRTFQDIFYSNLNVSKKVVIASGYISESSIIDLSKFIEVNKKPHLDLIVGMHFFEGLTSKQKTAITKLQEVLSTYDLGNVFFSTVTKYHGKVYAFYHENENPSEVMIGSSNLGSILSLEQVYETDLHLKDEPISNDIQNFLLDLKNKYCKHFVEVQDDITIKKQDLLFENHVGVEKIPQTELVEVYDRRTTIEFNIKLKAGDRHRKSNLNVYHGKGRENTRTGIIRPRPWYEIEIIVPKSTSIDPNYPRSGTVFTVYTDDGWKFQCKIGGTGSKEGMNFRSEGDLTIIGKWIKGRLENKGVLNIGDVVTEETLRSYGRDNFSFVKTSLDSTWLIDFGV